MRIRVVVSSLLVVLVSTSLAQPVSGQATGIRDVSASERSVIPLQTRLRYTTMIVLPEGEDILDVICGDKDFWVISATHNIAHVKPAKEGASTNLNLVTSSGGVYSFLLSEKNGAGTPDLKVYVTGDGLSTNGNGNGNAHGKPKYYSAAQMQGLQAELVEMRTALEAAQRHAKEMIATYQQEYPSRLQFAYGTPKYEKPFLVRAIWHDGQFTYIRSDSSELPALYEMKDGAPALVNFQVQGGTYVIPKVVDDGYLSLGKQRLPFGRQGR